MPKCRAPEAVKDLRPSGVLRPSTPVACPLLDVRHRLGHNSALTDLESVASLDL